METTGRLVTPKLLRGMKLIRRGAGQKKRFVSIDLRKRGHETLRPANAARLLPPLPAVVRNRGEPQSCARCPGVFTGVFRKPVSPWGPFRLRALCPGAWLGPAPRPRKAAPHLRAPRVPLFLIIPTLQNGKLRLRAIKERIQAPPAREWGGQHSDVSLSSSSEPLWNCARESGAPREAFTWKTGEILMLASFSSADGWKTKAAVKGRTCPRPGVGL